MNFQKPEILFPDYSNCNLGIFSSYLKHYGLSPVSPSLPIVDQILDQKHPRNIVFILMDALGSTILERHLPPQSFLRSHHAGDLIAGYPCTTVCVTTSFFSGLLPISHAWLAWSLYFKEWNQCIEVYPYRDAFTGERINPEEKNILDSMGFETIFEQIEKATENQVKVECVFSDKVRTRQVQMAGKHLTSVPTFEEMLQAIDRKCQEKGEHIIICHWKSPDDLLHNFGLESEQVTTFLADSDRLLAKYVPHFADSSLIITADHGMQQIENHFRLDNIDPLNELLAHYPSGDPRAKAIAVLPGKQDLFANRLKQETGDEFLLVPAEEVIKKGFLGDGPVHPRIADFLGDFLVIGQSYSDLLYTPPGGRPPKLFKGHHAGLTKDEMLVPLIMY